MEIREQIRRGDMTVTPAVADEEALATLMARVVPSANE